MIGRQVPLLQQPAGLSQINWGNPLTKGLVFAVNSNSNLPPDLVTGKYPSLIGGGASVTTTPEKFGLASRCVGGYLNYGRTKADDVTIKGTIVYVGRAETSPADVPVLCTDEGTFGHGFSLAIDNSVYVNNGFIFGFENGNVKTSLSNAIPSSLAFSVMVVTWDNVTVNLYANGVLRNQYTVATPIVADSNRITKLTNRFNPGTQNHRDALTLVYDRALTNGEAVHISASLYAPWQVLKPLTTPIFVSVGNGGLPAYIMQYWS